MRTTKIKIKVLKVNHNSIIQKLSVALTVQLETKNNIVFLLGKCVMKSDMRYLENLNLFIVIIFRKSVKMFLNLQSNRK